ncbi:conserved Plasmodium protein, unknown function [Plasmodium knowlesi strain H]|uniref:Uncharacterized protein n=3 Tax=Plasmodium knowlesi TaxID=5850 RepID=A0A5K1UUJ9_PLAKH|nr:conserved Plasmodium protein, unknown function [Plasmodium knowlesi strain H]OTN66951.1 Uncharacterized protein PKNOH_S07448700 [Plasmodium knowlesi]CAA9988614.1 conserved Plasmodium protein, unknown function [Plasmodium knowlesi strain H]SBO21452.1 conserved Plasmodium protein, unknown function [Plasmodium knowlesi strain H]SBO21888.1 conserved Plasmodium protein, unknown function [Plasmodium knowlesi strain H]VVS78088.1 conserved Plasmodium protein, unknown function [Plasmodium knowlesi s|eukprot:XP_002259590.1 hypothetical protein, conserved in Plasmodium species [Plasmodium knowlesi strain H]
MPNVNTNKPGASPDWALALSHGAKNHVGEYVQNSGNTKNPLNCGSNSQRGSFHNKAAQNSCSDSTRSSNPNNEVSSLDLSTSNNAEKDALPKNHNNDDTYELYQLNVKSSSQDPSAEKSKLSVASYIQQYDESYEERTKFNKKKSSFYDNNGVPDSYPFLHTYNISHTDNANSNYDNALHQQNNSSGGATPQKNNTQHDSMCDQGAAARTKDNEGESIRRPDNLENFRLGRKGTSKWGIENKDHQNGVRNDVESNSPNSLPNEQSSATYTCLGPNEVSPKEHTQNNGDGNRLSMHKHDVDKLYQNFCFNREKAMSHTKIFDYAGCEEEKLTKPKNKTSTFVPKYKNLSAKEIHFNSLAGNDNITILAANKMKLDLSKLSEKNEHALPDVYPFHLSSDTKNEEEKKRAHKPYLEKLYPTNFNYINTYKNNNANISLEERRSYMNSSHIFDCYDNKMEEPYQKESENTREVVTNRISRDVKNVDNEKEEKRKVNPLYSDLFGRKTPDINQNAPCEKIMPTTLNCNWMYCPIDTRKYSEQSFNSSDYLQSCEKGNFNRKSYFGKEVYDDERKKILQEALQKGSRALFKVHMQSILQDGAKYNLEDCNHVQATYLILHNIKDCVSDEEIKDAVRKSGAFVVTYEPEYDFLCNRRKSNAKLCIRHANGKEGLNLLTNLLAQLDITVHFM